eukprot:4232418-Amphidinium_carterae.1
MVYDGSAGLERWPLGFHDTLSAFIPKQLGVALDPSQLRPLLKKTVAKVLPAVWGNQLSTAELLHEPLLVLLPALNGLPYKHLVTTLPSRPISTLPFLAWSVDGFFVSCGRVVLLALELGLDPWMRFVPWMLWLIWCCGTWLSLCLPMVPLQEATGLRTQLMPLGAITDEEFQEALVSILPPDEM